MVKIIPAILSNDIREVEMGLKASESVVDRVQIDIVDGVFAPNRTIDPSALEGIDTPLSLDYHLMTKEPTLWVEKVARGGADRIIGQIEEMQSQIDFIAKVSEIGLSVGLAIDLETPVAKLDPVALTNIDVVLVMSVKAGFGGQKFDDKALAKIKELDKVREKDTTPFNICVDGGITEENLAKVVKAGADEVAVGKRIFFGELAANIERYHKSVYG